MNEASSFRRCRREAVERRSNAYFVEFHTPAAAEVRTHVHPRGEFIFVLEGTLEVVVAGDRVALEAQDSMYFDSSRPHGYRRLGAGACRAVVVTTPAES